MKAIDGEKLLLWLEHKKQSLEIGKEYLGSLFLNGASDVYDKVITYVADLLNSSCSLNDFTADEID